MSRPPEPITQTLDKEQYAAIGRVASEWSLFENYIDDTIWWLARVTQDVGGCFTAALPINRRFDVLAAFLRMRGVDEITIRAFNRVFNLAHDLSKKRNRVVHDTWYRGIQSKKKYRLEISSEKRPIFEYKCHPADEVNELAAQIRRLRLKFMRLPLEIPDAPAP